MPLCRARNRINVRKHRKKTESLKEQTFTVATVSGTELVEARYGLDCPPLFLRRTTLPVGQTSSYHWRLVKGSSASITQTLSQASPKTEANVKTPPPRRKLIDSRPQLNLGGRGGLYPCSSTRIAYLQDKGDREQVAQIWYKSTI